MACCDHGVAAVILFHRGEAGTWRAGIWPPPRHMRNVSATGSSARWPWPAAWTPSWPGDLPKALAVLTASSPTTPRNSTRSRDLLPDGVRLAIEIGDRIRRPGACRPRRGPRQRHRPSRTARPTRCYCQRPARPRRPSGCCGPQTGTATRAGRCSARQGTGGRGRGLPGHVADRGCGPGRVHPRRSTSTHHSAPPATSARLQARFRAHGIRRGPRVKHRKAQQRLGQPDARGSKGRRPGGPRTVQSANRREALPISPDGIHSRLRTS